MSADFCTCKNRTLQKKPDIEIQKPDIDLILNEKTKAFSEKTKAHLRELFAAFGSYRIFGRSPVMETLDRKTFTASEASDLIQRLLQEDVIEPACGYGKGKYRFKNV